jgi:hypothetical protein
VAVEVEGDGSIEIGAVDAGSRGGRRARTSVRGRPNEFLDPTEMMANWGLAAATSSGVVALALPWWPTLIKFAVG